MLAGHAEQLRTHERRVVMSQRIRVGVVGARGRMGTAACEAVGLDPDTELVAEVDEGDSLELLIEQRCQVVVDFTNPGVVMENIAFCVKNGIAVVVGTSGITPERVSNIELWVAQRPLSRVLVVPNFSIGAVLMIHFAEQAARYFDSVEIIEMHHPQKLDAPSGTALYTAERIAQARKLRGSIPDATTHDPLHARGANFEGVTIHSVRLSGLIARQEVLLGGLGETLSIRHDSLTRESFMPGVLLAIKEISHHEGVTVGLGALLFSE